LDKTPDFAFDSSRSTSYLALEQLITVAGVSNDIPVQVAQVH
jgi:hypothetical protein